LLKALISAKESIADQKQAFPDDWEQKYPYLHAGARPAKGVLNALSLTKDSHKPILRTKPLVRTAECEREDCARPTWEKNLCKHHFASKIKHVIAKQL
jgi:hypothetical protein